MKNSKKYDVIVAGEFLADLIEEHFTPDLLTTDPFRRMQGGSPANLAAYLAPLGRSLALVACVGNDSIGRYLLQEVNKDGVDTTFVNIDGQHPAYLDGHSPELCAQAGARMAALKISSPPPYPLG